MRETGQVAGVLRCVDDWGTRRRKGKSDCVPHSWWVCVFKSGQIGHCHRHVSAETLFEEAQKAGVLVSLATVYNFLHTFTKRGLVRELFVDSGTVHYDTNTTDHCHFVSEIDGSIIDAPATGIYERAIAVVPEDLRVVDVQVILRLRPKGGYHAPAKVLRS